MSSRFEGNVRRLVYTPRQIAETRYFSLKCVDALQGADLMNVLQAFLDRICCYNLRCVDLAAETLTG